MGIYYDEIVPFYIEANITGSWNLKDVLTKLLDFQPSPEKKNFFKENWNTERDCVHKAKRCYKQKDFKDPIDNYISVNIPQGKFLKVKDTLYPKCPKCGGRLYPSFKYCPYCSFDCAKQSKSCSIIPLNNNLLNLPKRSFVKMRSKDKREMRADKVVFDEDGMKVFESEIKNASKDKRNLEQ